MLDKSIDIKIATKELIRRLGGDPVQKISRATKMRIKKMELVFRKLVTPSFHYEKQKIVRIKKASVYVGNGISFNSKKLANSLQECTEMICFLATIGEGVDRKIKMLMEQNQISNAYILDAMGSEVMEDIVNRFYIKIRDMLRMKNRAVSLRFSPGYCDWPVEDQEKLFQLFKSKPENVTLTESCMMRPRKSISGVLGVKSPSAQVTQNPYNPCNDCQRRNCDARRADPLVIVQNR